MGREEKNHPTLFHKKVAFSVLRLPSLCESLIHFGLLVESEFSGNNFSGAKKQALNKEFWIPTLTEPGTEY